MQHATTDHADQFPAVQLGLLALVRLAEPIALTSVFPYAYKLVLRFHFGPPDYAAAYAGILIAAFSFAESCTGIFWGGLSDRIGRRPVLLLGCLGTLASLLIVGFSDSFWVALAGRILGGALNGNVGVVQTMVGELVQNPKHEPKAYAIMPFVWSVGAIIGPAVGGTFAEPAKTFPHVFSKTGLFARYPYLLPNVLCSSLLLLAVVLGVALIEETHPDLQRSAAPRSPPQPPPSRYPTGATEHAPADIRRGQYGTFNDIEVPEGQVWDVWADGKEYARAPPSAYSRQVLLVVAALGLFTYVSMTYDHLMPIFLQYPRAAQGVGLSTQQVGLVMSVNGAIALLIQGVVFPALASWLGIWRLLLVVTVGHPLAFVVVPLLAWVPVRWVYPAIYACLALRNLFSILAYPLLLVLIKESCPSRACLGRINGLAASVAGAARCLASPVAGGLFGVGARAHFLALPWLVSAVVAVLTAGQVFLLRRGRETAVVHAFGGLERGLGGAAEEAAAPRQVVRIQVHDERQRGGPGGGGSDERDALLGS